MSYAFAAKLLPRAARESYRSMLQYSGIKMQAEQFMGFMVLFGLGVAFAVAFDLMAVFVLDGLLAVMIFIASFVVIETGAYMRLWFHAESKAKLVDNVLPDALRMMAMNIRSGLTTDRALMLSARPEFGPLEEEIRRAGKEIMAGEDAGSALMQIPKRIRSRTLDSAMKLLADSLKSGGDIADLLDQTSADIERTRLMNKEVAANVLMYVIFIFFAAGIGAPLVFGISIHLVGAMSAQAAHFSGFDASQFGLKLSGFGSVSVSSDFLVLYALASLAATSLFGGLIMGLIKEGSEKDGFKFVPLLLCLSIAVFFITTAVASSLFSI